MNLPNENPDSGYEDIPPWLKEDKTDLDYQPNQKMHLYISLVKSGLRFIASGAMIFSGIPLVAAAGWFLLSAEILGVVEELV